MNSSKKLAFSFFVSASVMSVNAGMYNNVHAAGTVPNIQSSAYTSVGNIFAKCGYKGQCTWFTYGRTLEKLGIALPSEFYGNAIEWWYANSRDNVYPYGSEPRANSIAVWSGGSAGNGHVGFVEDVQGDTVYLNEGNFNVRKGYDGSVKQLSKSQMKDRGNVFLKGYIYLDSGRASVPASSKSDPQTQVTETNVKVGTVKLSSSSSLNVRNGANTSFGVVGSLSNSQSVQIIGTVGNWYKIKFNSTYGYVNGDYVKVGNILSPNEVKNTSSTTTTTASSKTGYVKLSNNSSSLNLRNSPNGSIIGYLSNGIKLTIVGTQGSWYKVCANGKTGYVSSSYISETQVSSNASSASTLSNANSSGKTGTVTLKNSSSILNLRNSPWTGRVIGSLSNGNKVTILGSSGRWYKISTSSGVVGYVHSDYIRL